MTFPKIKRSISRIIPFGIIWLIFSVVYTLLEKGLLGNLNYYPSTGNPYHFGSAIFLTPAVAFITGLCLGIFDIFFINKWFAKMSFGKKIFIKSSIYLIFISLFLVLLTALSNYLELNTGFFNIKVWGLVWAFFFTYTFLSVVLYVASIILVSQFYAELSENVGLGVLRNFFTGKYHKPVEEERIFMFLDMKASTTIAENMGHIRYFQMLKEYYSDLSPSIVNYYGEIYQYVGDEIVVSWKLKNGLKNNNCIQCFFAMKAALEQQTSKYQKKFGLLPQFKAGFHLGKITTGEIGVVKREIIFTGDVLNTTARVQGLCNIYGVDNLISGELIKKLDLHFTLQIKAFGEHELRGRDEKIELFTILL